MARPQFLLVFARSVKEAAEFLCMCRLQIYMCTYIYGAVKKTSVCVCVADICICAVIVYVHVHLLGLLLRRPLGDRRRLVWVGPLQCGSSCIVFDMCVTALDR